MPYVSALTVLANHFLNHRFKHNFSLRHMGKFR
jgi:hypothetical protein